jgi:transcriptional regulator with GAF, ATPase, and Fis domain
MDQHDTCGAYDFARAIPETELPGLVRCDPIDIVPLRIARRNATNAFEIRYLENVLARANGSILRAAELSRVSRQMLQKLMRKHGVRLPR